MNRKRIVLSGFVIGLSAHLAGAQMFPDGPSGPLGCPPLQPLGKCPDCFPSEAAFKILFLDGSTLVQGGFQDPATIIGRSDPYNAGTLYGAIPPPEICCAGPAAPPECLSAGFFPDMLITPPAPCRPTNEWVVFDTPVFDTFFGPLNNVYWSPVRRRVATEFLSLELVHPLGATIRAGQPYYDAVVSTPQFRYFSHSTGEVASRFSPDYLEPGGSGPADCIPGLCCPAPPPDPPCQQFCNPPCYDENQDFDCTDMDLRCVPLEPGCAGFAPSNCFAASFFNLFLEVELPNGIKAYNKTPLVVRASINQFPPDLTLPQSIYIHDPDFGGVALFDQDGLPFGYLVSAGHGSQTVPPALPNDSPLVLPFPAAFSVDQDTLGLDPLVTLRPPNDVFADQLLDEKKVTVYLSSGLNPGSIPDMSNARDPVLRGVPPAFAPNDRINSFSYGRDGAAGEVFVVPNQELWDAVLGPFATAFFSVSRGTQGEPCSDVRYNTTPNQPALPDEQAADVYASRCGPFGGYDDPGAIFIPFTTKNLLAADQTHLGLEPLLVDLEQDNVAGLELAEFDSSPPGTDLFYATFDGPSFSGPGQRATIYLYDAGAGGAFELGNLTVFSDQAGISMTPADLGLVDDDVIDALVLSDITPGDPAAGIPRPCPQQPNGIMDRGNDQVLFSLAPGSPSLAGGSPADVFRSSFDGSRAQFLTADELGLLPTDDVDALDIKGYNSQPGGACCFPSGACLFVTDDACITLQGNYLGDGSVCLGDGDGNSIDDACQIGGTADCNNNGIPDACDIAAGTSVDCNTNGIPDVCDLAAGNSVDCNTNGTPDVCDLAAGTSLDCNGNGKPDECEVGACCYGGGGCAAVLSLVDCMASGGFYQGDGAPCPPMACAAPQPTEACCDPGGGCTQQDRFVCLAGGGTPQGFGTWCNPCTGACPLSSGGSLVTKTFCIQGSGNGTPWSWSLTGQGWEVSDLNTPGVTGPGDVVAAYFATQINATGCVGLSATVDPATPQCFNVTAFGSSPSLALCVGQAGQQPCCCVQSGSVCPFNPDIFEVVLSGSDCNSNGVDDALDITSAGSADCNFNGIPDECEPPWPDFDFDGDVDNADYSQFYACLTGPCANPPCIPPLYAGGGCCHLADMDADGDIDLVDVRSFQNFFTGP